MTQPALIKPVPPQVVNEHGTFGPFDLKPFIASENNSPLVFSAELKTGESLPKGMICTADGIVTGIPAEGTQGFYEVVVTASNESGSLEIEFNFTIKPNMAGGSPEYFDKLKAQVWEALDQKLPIPDLSELYDRPITAVEVYYLLERFGLIKIWDAFNLDSPGEKVLLELEGASKHYNVYDRGSCLVATPKELFSHERTLEDGLQTARAMAREAYNRGWTVELVGFHKLTRAAWVEIQRLGEVYANPLEVINYNPTPDDYKLVQASLKRMQSPGMES
jgi:hypothetical protein